jgi:lambda family phage portal protein
MKPSFLDNLIGFFSPIRKLRRLQVKEAEKVLLSGREGRDYEAAKNYPTSSWVTASDSDVNEEVRKALTVLRKKSRDLARNSPFALKAINVIVNNTVGAGILPNIKGRNKTQTKKLQELWKQVAETSLCDSNGRNNFTTMQAIAMRSIVESGEVVALKEMTPEAPKMKILESDHIVSDQEFGSVTQGIEVDVTGKPIKYFLYKNHPGSKTTSSEIVKLEADKLAHAFKQERPGQLRGIPWAHSVIETLKDLNDYQYAHLIGKKVAACLVGTIISNGDSALTPAQRKERRENELQMTPGTFRYLDQGEDVKFSNPPSAAGYAEYVRECHRAIASGFGATYEAVTGDYSQVNFSSGRMGHIEFRRNIDSWRWTILIPHFCDPYFRWFLEWAKAKGVDTEGATCEWIPPAYVMVDPVKEVAAEKEAVKAGFKSRSRVITEMGDDPEAVREEIKSEREADAKDGLVFDTNVANETPKVDNEVEDSEEGKTNPSDESV